MLRQWDYPNTNIQTYNVRSLHTYQTQAATFQNPAERGILKAIYLDIAGILESGLAGDYLLYRLAFSISEEHHKDGFYLRRCFSSLQTITQDHADQFAFTLHWVHKVWLQAVRFHQRMLPTPTSTDSKSFDVNHQFRGAVNEARLDKDITCVRSIFHEIHYPGRCANALIACCLVTNSLW